MATRRRSPYLTQAQARAVVRFSPEESALVELLRQAHDTFTQGVAAAKGGALSTIQTIDQTRPQLERVYDIPGVNPAQAAQAVTAPALPAAGSLDFRSAAQFEQQAALNRLTGARTAALADLSGQRVRAAQGAQFATQQARSQYVHDLGTINRRLVDLAGQQGAYITDQLGTLEQQAYQRALTRRGQDVTARGQSLSHADRLLTGQQRQDALAETRRHHLAQEKNPGGSRTPLLPGGVKQLPQSEHNTLANAASQARVWAARLLPHLKGTPAARRHQAAQLLLTGAKSSTGGSVPRIGNELGVAVGLDLAQFGHVTDGTSKRLHAAGYSVKALGVPGAPRKRGTAFNVGAAVAHLFGG